MSQLHSTHRVKDDDLSFSTHDSDFVTGHGLGHGVEYVSLGIFGLFAVIDLLFCKSVKWNQERVKSKTPANAEEKLALQKELRSLEMKYDFSRDSFIFIDLPVILGVLIVLGLSYYFINTNELKGLTDIGGKCFDEVGVKKPRDCMGQSGVTEIDKIFESFMHGFSTGALVMHLAFSQLIFGLLKLRDKFQRYKENLPDDSYA